MQSLFNLEQLLAINYEIKVQTKIGCTLFYLSQASIHAAVWFVSLGIWHITYDGNSLAIPTSQPNNICDMLDK